MPNFKDPGGRIHFLSVDDIAAGGIALLPVGCLPVTDIEARAAEQAFQAATDAKPSTPTAAKQLANLLVSKNLITAQDAATIETQTKP